MKLFLTLILLISLAVSDDLPFHSGSINEMDRRIDLQNSITDIYVVDRLVSVYSNTVETKRKIVDAVIKYSREYNIDPVTLASLLAKESSMNQYAKHSQVFVKVPLKKNWTKIGTAKCKAVGMGGVIYEIWKYELAEIGIKNRKALYNIDNNIKAAAKILSIYTHERKQLKHTVTKEESALLRYYGVTRDKRGVPNKTYSTQVYKIRKTVRG